MLLLRWYLKGARWSQNDQEELWWVLIIRDVSDKQLWWRPRSSTFEFDVVDCVGVKHQEEDTSSTPLTYVHGSSEVIEALLILKRMALCKEIKKNVRVGTAPITWGASEEWKRTSSQIGNWDCTNGANWAHDSWTSLRTVKKISFSHIAVNNWTIGSNYLHSLIWFQILPCCNGPGVHKMDSWSLTQATTCVSLPGTTWTINITTHVRHAARQWILKARDKPSIHDSGNCCDWKCNRTKNTKWQCLRIFQTSHPHKLTDVPILRTLEKQPLESNSLWSWRKGISNHH